MHILWIGGAGCDGCTTAALGAADPSVDDFLLGRVRDAPDITLVHPLLALESGDAYRRPLEEAAEGSLAPFLLVLEGSVFDESLAGSGYYSRLGHYGGTAMTTAAWLDRLAPRAEAVIAIGSCATWGGIPAAAGNPTGAMGLQDHLGPAFKSRAGLPVVNVPGCAPSGEAFLEALAAVLLHLGGSVPLELDAQNRPRWLYPAHATPCPPGADAVRAEEAPGPAIGCPVPRQGWSKGLGGCARVGGACIGCTAPGFADRYLEPARRHRTT